MSRKKTIICVILVLIAVVLTANFSSLKDRFDIWRYHHTQWLDGALIHKTNAGLDKDMSQSQADIGPALRDLGYTIAEPSRSSCGEGDPTLYKYDCSAQAIITPQSSSTSNATPAKISSATLSSFSAQLTQKHWRSAEGNQYTLTWFDSYAYYNKETTLGVYFDKGNCHLDLGIQLPIDSKSQAPSYLTCSKFILDGFFY